MTIAIAPAATKPPAARMIPSRSRPTAAEKRTRANA
jgi:hypothetical protein